MVFDEIKKGDMLELKFRSFHNQRQHVHTKGVVIHKNPGKHLTILDKALIYKVCISRPHLKTGRVNIINHKPGKRKEKNE